MKFLRFGFLSIVVLVFSHLRIDSPARGKVADSAFIVSNANGSLTVPASGYAAHDAQLSNSSGEEGDAPISAKNETRAMRIGVVISSYCKDDLRFLDHLPCDKYRIYIYAKCETKEKKFAEAPSQRECVTISEYSNALNGRDSESHLHHIVEHYNDLEQFSFFLQGNTEVKGDALSEIATLGSEASGLTSENSTSMMQFTSLGFHPFHVACCLEGDDVDNKTRLGGANATRALFETFAAVTHQEYPTHGNDVICTFRGEFGVSARRIRAEDHRFYEWMLLMSVYSMHPRMYTAKHLADG